MNPYSFVLQLDHTAHEFQAGQDLVGQFYREGSQAIPLRAVELSVLWYTAGQGDEDFDVHYFHRYVDELARPLDLRRPLRFATTLPPSPLSYDGQIVKVCWCVRARLFPQQGPEAVVEVPIRLGSVTAAVIVEEETSATKS
jgi:hypothetical protein